MMIQNRNGQASVEMAMFLCVAILVAVFLLAHVGIKNHINGLNKNNQKVANEECPDCPRKSGRVAAPAMSFRAVP